MGRKIVLRVAVIDRESCNPDRCTHECQRFCPPVRMGIPAVEFIDGKPIINEALCIGCGICVKKCPFEAITIVNLPQELEEEIVHQYGLNEFRLFRLPMPQKNQVLGIIGRNGTGKSTAIKILAGKIIPNFGEYDKEATTDKVIEYYRGQQLYFYFKDLYSGRLRIAYKPQEVYLLPKIIKGKVKTILKKLDETGKVDEVVEALDLRNALNKSVKELSGGEMQRLAIAAAGLKEADVYLLDEPSSYNDVYQRMKVARFIRNLAKKKYVVVVDHDLAFLDYLSDVISVVYGTPGAYGIFTRTESVRTGINIFLDGFIPADNIRFREKPIVFTTVALSHKPEDYPALKYTGLRKKFGKFQVYIEEGEIRQGEVVGILGPNAIGKTTFFRMLVGEIPIDDGEILIKPEKLAYKPQYLSTDYDGTVQDFLIEKAGSKALSEFSVDALLKPLNIYNLLERRVKNLSGGELQKVFVAATLLMDADLYLLDEPSAFIDVEDRIEVALAINRFIKLNKKPAAVIDHDLIVIDAISDRIIVFDGEPAVNGHASPPMHKRDGMNRFLSDVDITLRRDRHSGRPRINKPNSRLDREQKEKKEYYYVA
jgi:ATP-binding cassette subfamily E protein 1